MRHHWWPLDPKDMSGAPPSWGRAACGARVQTLALTHYTHPYRVSCKRCRNTQSYHIVKVRGATQTRARGASSAASSALAVGRSCSAWNLARGECQVCRLGVSWRTAGVSWRKEVLGS